jgi:hypothetical protein
VPAHNLLAPTVAWVIAAARVMPDVCAVFKSSSSECTILTPCFAQSIGKPLVEFCIFDAYRGMFTTDIEESSPLPGKSHRVANASSRRIQLPADPFLGNLGFATA